jgi:hypothetical protein
LKFYHWTKKRIWQKIKACGYLKSGTYYAPTPWLWNDEYNSGKYGMILLEINYLPKRIDFRKEHNYGFDPPHGQCCVQFNIFKNIPLSEIKMIKDIKTLRYLKNEKPQCIEPE